MGKTLIYQMLPRLWGEGKFSSADVPTLDYIRSMGFSHIWLTGVVRHSTGKPFVKGDPGSPYAVSDWYDVNPYLADNQDDRMLEFENLIKRCHDAGLKVITDFIPNHVGRDYGRDRVRNDIAYLGDGDNTDIHWSPENDFYYYPGERFRLPVSGEWDEFPARATGNNFTPTPTVNDWYDTIKINYGTTHTPTWDKMLDVLLFWAGKGVDGFRCDMVELVPKEFFKWAIARAKESYPDLLFVAEVYQKESYRGYLHEVGFDCLYDKSGLYDSLRAIVSKNIRNTGTPVELWQSTRSITWNWQSLSDLQPQMLNFLENHDEQRVASSAFAAKPANAFAALHVSLLFNTAPFMLYFGQETGTDAAESQDCRTSIFNLSRSASIDRLNAWIHGTGDLSEEEEATLARYRGMLQEAGSSVFAGGKNFDLCYCSAGNEGFDSYRHFAFLRHDGKETRLVFCNFSTRTAEADVTIPKLAAEMFGISERTIRIGANACDATIMTID